MGGGRITDQAPRSNGCSGRLRSCRTAVVRTRSAPVQSGESGLRDRSAHPPDGRVQGGQRRPAAATATLGGRGHGGGRRRRPRVRRLCDHQPAVFTRVDAISAWVRGWAKDARERPARLGIPAGRPRRGTHAGRASLATGRVRLGNDAISLVLGCDNEGGVCRGDVEAIVGVRDRVIAGCDGTRTVVSTRTLTVTPRHCATSRSRPALAPRSTRASPHRTGRCCPVSAVDRST